jgi:hypothetical protein
MVRDVRAEGHCGRKLSNPVHSDAEKLLQIYEFIIQNTSLEERLERKYRVHTLSPAYTFQKRQAWLFLGRGDEIKMAMGGPAGVWILGRAGCPPRAGSTPASPGRTSPRDR